MPLTASSTERLEDGQEPETPDGDNLVLDFARCQASACAATASAGRGRVDRDDVLGVQFADLGVPSPFGNVALLERPVGESAIPVLAATLQAFFGGRAGGRYLVFSPWPLDLAGHGFDLAGHPPLMVRPVGAATEGVHDLRIEEVADADRLADFERTFVEAYPVSEMLPWQRGVLFDPALLDTGWRLFVGYDDHDEPVATSGAYVGPTLTDVELVSTRPEYRRRGHGAAMTSAATMAVANRPAMLISSDLGRHTYEHSGYLALLRYSLWVGTR